MKHFRVYLCLVLVFLLVLSPDVILAAIPQGAVWSIRQDATASNVNGGFFNVANASFLTDYTTDSNTANTSAPVVSSASYNFVAGDVGAWLFISAGTNWTSGRSCPIASVASNKATLNAAIGACVDRTTTLGTPSPRWTASTTVGIASVGTPTSGTIGIDYSQGTTSITTDADLATTTGTTNPCTVTSSGHPFGVNHTGNALHINSGGSYTADWYQIVSVSGSTATLDKACSSSATDSGGTYHVGGSMSLNSTLDDDLFEKGIQGNHFFIKYNASAYALGEALSIAATGGTLNPIMIEGYTSLYGDKPYTVATRPLISTASAITLPANWEVYNIGYTTQAAAGLSLGADDKLVSSRIVNDSTTADRASVTLTTDRVQLIANEFVSLRGTGIITGGNHLWAYGNTFHHSNIGITNNVGAATVGNLICNVFYNNVTAAYSSTAADTGMTQFINNTFRGLLTGAGVQTSTGINFAATSRAVTLINNIITGFATGVVHGSTQNVGFDNYNNYYSNTADVSSWQKGPADLALDPQFTSVTDRAGTTATTTSGNHLVQSGATFQTWGVVAGDYLYVHSGTGPTTPAMYVIASVDSETQVTTTQTLTANATANKSWSITQGYNFAVGANMKAAGFPGIMPGSLQTGYMDMGCIQRQEPTSSGGGGGIISGGN